MQSINRRDFLRQSAAGFGAFMVAQGLQGCGDSVLESSGPKVRYDYGIASGDPLTDRAILWTRVTPELEQTIQVGFEVARDASFNSLVTTGTIDTDTASDYTVKIDATGLDAGTTYHYRFVSGGVYSPTGTLKTLPLENIESVKLGVVSCANYPAGHFHVYSELAKQEDLDAVVHLGDYIYEYGEGGYATEDALALGRQPVPAHETLTLEDYRTRYKLYRLDPSLQAAHARHTFICVWDDHEVANDAWATGSQNHSPDEGDFSTRKQAALQAYFEWLPVRPPIEDDQTIIYRRFNFGSLLSLHMLDTRQVARMKSLMLDSYFGEESVFNLDRFESEVSDESRTLLGEQQLNWLLDGLEQSEAKWQVLGQQVLMGEMVLPGGVAANRIGLLEYVDLLRLKGIVEKEEAGQSLSNNDQAFLDENRERMTQEVRNLLELPVLPYNLDAWDGYPVERETLLNHCKEQDLNLVVLAGDTHNAWANNLKTQDGTKVGVEFATASVSSPGLEYYLGLDTEAAVMQAEMGAVAFVPAMQFANMSNRGFMLVTFTPEEASSQWVFVDTVKSETYSLLESRTATKRCLPGSENRSLTRS